MAPADFTVQFDPRRYRLARDRPDRFIPSSLREIGFGL